MGTVMTTPSSVVLPPDPRSAKQAREFVSDQLERLHPEYVDAAQLLISELVTNAVLHARTDITLRIKPHDDGVRIEVLDSSTTRALPKHYSDDASTGRGLMLVEALADAWGTDVDGDHKVVWFELS